MKNFIHMNAMTLDEAVTVMQRYGKRAWLMAGGTDLLGKMKDEIMPDYPEVLVNIKTIPGLDFIDFNKDFITIGALTRLEDIARNEYVNRYCFALAQAARRTASTHLREMGTIGGNICQDIRCWYYRNPNNRFPCLRKGGGRCYAIDGDNRYHSIFGGSVEQGCYAVHPSDTAPALIALDAVIKTTKRSIKAGDLFAVSPRKTTIIDHDEIVTAIEVPLTESRSNFLKFSLRKTIDFPIVNCAVALTLSGNQVKSARICLNAVYVVPYRVQAAEGALIGKGLDEAVADKAATLGVSAARPMSCNAYMVNIARVLIKRTVLGCLRD